MKAIEFLLENEYTLIHVCVLSGDMHECLASNRLGAGPPKPLVMFVSKMWERDRLKPPRVLNISSQSLC